MNEPSVGIALKPTMRFHDEGGRHLEIICTDPVNKDLWHLQLIMPGEKSVFRKRKRMEVKTITMSADRIRELIIQGRRPQGRPTGSQRYALSRAGTALGSRAAVSA